MRRVLATAVAMMAAGGWPMTVCAQDRLAAVRQLRDVQIARYVAFKDSVDRAEAAAPVVTGDTLTSPAYRLFVPAKRASLGQDLVAATETAFQGSWIRVSALDTSFHSLSVDSNPGSFRRLLNLSTSKLAIYGRNGTFVTQEELNGIRGHDSLALSSAGRMLAKLSYERHMRSVLPNDVLVWAGGLPPFDTVTAEQWRIVARRLPFSPLLPAQQCLHGDVRACRVVLGLESLADPAHDELDADGRRALVYYLIHRSTLSKEEARDSAAMRRQCVEGRDDAACERFVRLHLLSQLGNIGGPAPRNSFLRFVAVRSTHNADSALAILANQTTDIGRRLEALGGAPLDRLVAEWQQQVVGHAESATRVTAASTWAVMLLTLLFGTMGVMGSRWR